MAATYRPYDALAYAKLFIKNMPLEKLQARILDDANKYIWMAAPWRWTISSLSSTITLVNGQQDYTLAPPANFLKPIYAYIADGTTTKMDLDISPSLPSDVVQKGTPTRMAYMGSNTWRFYPIPVVSGTKEVIIEYKKKSPTITNQTSYTEGYLEMDDEWFWVYEQAVLWKAYWFADDQRGGNTQFDNSGKWAMTQARAELDVSIEMMRQRELLPIYNFQTVPEAKAGNR